MTATRTPKELPPAPEEVDQDVIDWRRDELERAGYSKPHAEQIARRHQGEDAIDLHKAVELLANGCNPYVAADILI